MEMSSFDAMNNLLGLIFFWTKWISFILKWIRPSSYSKPNVIPNRLLATLKCESLVTPRFELLNLCVSVELRIFNLLGRLIPSVFL